MNQLANALYLEALYQQIQPGSKEYFWEQFERQSLKALLAQVGRGIEGDLYFDGFYMGKIMSQTASSIMHEMQEIVEEHIDSRTGEVNLTSLVEAWDNTYADGEQTLDPDHLAWEIAVEVAEETQA